MCTVYHLILPIAIKETIGSGGFAKVKVAKHKVTGEKAAIKIMEKTRLRETVCFPSSVVEVPSVSQSMFNLSRSIFDWSIYLIFILNVFLNYLFVALSSDQAIHLSIYLSFFLRLLSYPPLLSKVFFSKSRVWMTSSDAVSKSCVRRTSSDAVLKSRGRMTCTEPLWKLKR
jgi:hypothetical protein